jgi:hypothetical protein
VGLRDKLKRLERYVEGEVEKRLEAELEDALNRLEAELPPDQYRCVLKIMAATEE